MLQKLKQLYPDLRTDTKPDLSGVCFSLSYKNHWLLLPKNSVSDKELLLLEMLLTEEGTKKNRVSKPVSHWERFLLGFSPELPGESGIYRCLHFFFDHQENLDLALWKEAVTSLFSDLEDILFIGENEAIAVQSAPSAGSVISLTEVQGMIATLDDDFSTRTRVFIGRPHSLDSKFQRLFLEEQVIFSTERDIVPFKIMDLSLIALSYFTKQPVMDSLLMEELKEQLSLEPDWKDLVRSLWTTQGNISLAAKQLYLHRNTLQYRMEGFENQM